MSAAFSVCVAQERLDAIAGDDAAETGWFDVRNGAVVLPEGEKLAFDHEMIIRDALRQCLGEA